MKLVSPQLGLLLALCPVTPLFAQSVDSNGDIRVPSQDQRLILKYATFDPLLTVPEVPGTLQAGADVHMWIVQFQSPPTDRERDAVRELGGRLMSSLPNDSLVVRMSAATAAAVAVQKQVRWVGPYQPAYRLEAELLREHLTGADVPVRSYNMVMADKRTEKAALEAKILALGGKVVDRHIQGLLFTAELTGQQLLMAARLDEVLWIDRWTPNSDDMDNARIVQGSNTIETAAGYTGIGVRGHVHEGVEFNHPDFTTAMTNVDSGGAAQDHGHCTAGCIFGNGNSAPQARGHAPGAVGFYTNYTTPIGTRNAIINNVVNTHNCMFTTASWGAAQTTVYTSISADADDIIFDHRIPWTQSMSNLGTQSVRPQAWAKNIISVGGLSHGNDSNPANDVWTSASVGPAADGRIKPDLCNFYDNVWTSDLSGAAGYSAGNSTTGFNGTSSATPITAGLNALAIQMYTDHIFNNTPRVSGGTRFQNRPYAQTLKALQICGASLYPIAQATRPRAGWGYANVATLYAQRDRIAIIPEDRVITQGATHTYTVNVLSGEPLLKICMTFLDPQDNPVSGNAAVNNLSLRVVSPGGTIYFGNNGLSASNTSSAGGVANTIDTVENVFISSPTTGNWTVEITAPSILVDAHVATAATDATYALAVCGGRIWPGSGCARYIPDTSTTGTVNVIPFGTTAPASLPTVFASNNQGSVGGAVYYNVTPTSNTFITSLDVNTGVVAGTPITLDLYFRGGTHVGFEGSTAGWIHRTTGHGVSAGLDLPSLVHLNEPLFISPVLVGLAIVARNFEHRYTNGNGANQVYSNADLTISAGSATNAPFTGAPFTPRVANHTVYYRTDTSAWTNQLYQTILRREDLGTAGSIRGLAFSPDTTGHHFNRELVVRMSHVPAGTTLSTTFATNLPTPVTVLNKIDHTWHTTADTWTDLDLTSSFAYNGTSDVVVEIKARGNHLNVLTGFNGFNRSPGNVPRVYAVDWPFSAVPAVATGNDLSGQRIRVSFNCATGSEYGTSCGSLVGTHSGTPNRGGSAVYDLNGAVANSGAIIGLGFNSGSPFPTSLTGSGFTGCFTWHSLTTTLFKLTNATGFATHSIGIPNSSAFDGVRIHGIWYQLDATQPGGLTVSNYITNVIGIDP